MLIANFDHMGLINLMFLLLTYFLLISYWERQNEPAQSNNKDNNNTFLVSLLLALSWSY